MNYKHQILIILFANLVVIVFLGTFCLLFHREAEREHAWRVDRQEQLERMADKRDEAERTASMWEELARAQDIKKPKVVGFRGKRCVCVGDNLSTVVECLNRSSVSGVGTIRVNQDGVY